MAATKIRGLHVWCQRMTDGYAHVDVSNFTSSWRDGLAFCALIHRFRPDLIDYESLKPENVFENCKLAFEIAEQELDIPAFLEAEDMAALKAPDKLSVITYVSEYYNVLSPLPQIGGPGVRVKFSNKVITGSKRSTDSVSKYAPAKKKAAAKETNENATPMKEKALSAGTGDICGICQQRVYLMERHMEEGKLYHRSCFRHSELSPTNKVYTRSPFLSPSLNSEKSVFTYPSTNNANSLATDVQKTPTDLLPSEEETKHSVTTSISKKHEAVGTKHQIDAMVTELVKKSKLQSEGSLDEDKSKKAAIIARLQNLKAKYSGSKGTEVSSALPLSGKEARKIERKREESLTPLKPAAESPKSSKRNTFLLNQAEMQTHEALKPVRPASTVAAVLSSSSTPASSIAKTATSTSHSVAVSTSSTSTPQKSNSRDSYFKDKVLDIKTKKTFGKDSLDTTVPNKNTPLLSHNSDLDRRKSELDSSKTPKTNQPVAKPRTPRSVGGVANKDEILNKPVLKSLPEEKTLAMTPKPTPRKSMLEGIKTENISEQPKIPERKKSVTNKAAHTDDLELSRLHSTSTALPLPSSAPPLPSSAPPPLPVTGPIGQINASITDKNINRKHSTELTPREEEKPFHEADKNNSSSENIDSEKPVESCPNINTNHERNKPVHFDKNSDNDSIENSEKLKTAHTNVDDTKSTTECSDQHHSLSVSTLDNNLVVHVAEAQNDSKEMGLASLDEVKDNNCSPSVSNNIIISLSPPVLSSSINEIKPSSTTPETNNKNKPCSSTESSDNEASPLTSPVLNVTNSSKVFDDTTAKLQSEEIAKIDINVTQPVQMDKDPTELHNVDDCSTETSRQKDVPLNLINTNTEVKYGSEVLSLSEDAIQKSQLLNNRNDFKLDNLHPTPTKRSVSNDESRSTILRDEKIAEFARDDLDISSIDYQQNMSKGNNLKELSLDNFIGASKELIEINSTKENLSENCSDANKDSLKTDITIDHSSESFNKNKESVIEESFPMKPPRLVKMSRLAANQEKHEQKVKEEEKTSDQKVAQSISNVTEEVLEETSLQLPDKTTIGEVILDESKDLPQWKKDIEARKEKLRQDIAKSETETDTLKRLKEKRLGKAAKISAAVSEKENIFSDEYKPEGNESVANTTEAQDDKTKGHLSKRIRKEELEKISILEERLDKEQKEEPEVVLRKTKLKSAEVNANNLSMKDSLKNNKPVDNVGDNNKNYVSKDVSRDDKELAKSMNKSSNDTCNNSSKQNNQIQTLHLNGPVTFQSHSTDNLEESSTRNVFNKDKRSTNASQSCHAKADEKRLNVKRDALFETVDLNAETSGFNGKDYHGGRPVSVLSEGKLLLQTRNDKDKNDDQQASPKMRRKITVIGRDIHKVSQSPPTSPLPMKKIEVDTKFNFEESGSDFEISLTDSTAKLSIHDKNNSPPPRPPPPRLHHKTVHAPQMSAIELQQKLLDIDSQLTELEIRGRDLEESIRYENTLEEDDGLVDDWFLMVSERNELVRKEADLLYISKQQELEDEQEHIESQLRYLISKADDCKSAEEKQEEVYLIRRKVELVEQRNKIIVSMDEDRIRYETEDRNIKKMRDSGLWRNSTGSTGSIKERKTSKSVFYT